MVLSSNKKYKSLEPQKSFLRVVYSYFKWNSYLYVKLANQWHHVLINKLARTKEKQSWRCNKTPQLEHFKHSWKLVVLFFVATKQDISLVFCNDFAYLGSFALPVQSMIPWCQCVTFESYNLLNSSNKHWNVCRFSPFIYI